MSDDTEDAVFLGAGEKKEQLLLRLANRHGLITGATGTGKTVSLQIIAEGLSEKGVPVFAADVKGDLAGLAAPGVSKPFLEERAAKIGLANYRYRAFPVIFWDLFGEQGHPIRATVKEMGALLLSRLLELNDVQEGVLNIAFRVADDGKLPLHRFAGSAVADRACRRARGRALPHIRQCLEEFGRRDPAAPAGA